MIHAVVLLSKKIPFGLLLLLPSFTRTVQVPTQFFMICRTAVCDLTAVLTLYLLPDSSDFVFIARGFSTWHRAKETMPRNVVQLSKTIVAPHFKLLTRLRLSCSFLSSGQHAYSNHSDEVAAIVVKLFDQIGLGHCRLMWRCLTSKKQCLACEMERSLCTARTPVS